MSCRAMVVEQRPRGAIKAGNAAESVSYLFDCPTGYRCLRRLLSTVAAWWCRAGRASGRPAGRKSAESVPQQGSENV